MTITASRLSDTDFLVDHTVYTFSDSAVANAFQRCMAQDSVDGSLNSSTTDRRPMSSPAANNAAPDAAPPDSTISPPPGDVP